MPQTLFQDNFLINFTNNIIGKIKIAPINKGTTIIATYSITENITDKKSIVTIPRKTNTAINTFFITSTPSIREIISCLRRFCKYSVSSKKINNKKCEQ